MSKRTRQNEQPSASEEPAASPNTPVSPLTAPEQLTDTTPLDTPSQERTVVSGARSPLPAAIAGALPSPLSAHHLLFGAVEDVLADLEEQGAPDGNVVRVERLVRSRQQTMGGVATQGVLVTARRNDEVLSAWVIVGRLALDPWGQPLDHERARASAARHREAQRVIGAQVADAGFAVRTGLYLLPDAGYGFAATSASLDTLTAFAAQVATAAPDENPSETPPATNEADAQAEEQEGGAEDA